MTPTELEEKIKVFIEDIQTNDTSSITQLDDDQIHALLAWEFWKDGADWNDLVEDIATGQYLPFNTRVAAIDQLRKVYGYQ